MRTDWRQMGNGQMIIKIEINVKHLCVHDVIHVFAAVDQRIKRDAAKKRLMNHQVSAKSKRRDLEPRFSLTDNTPKRFILKPKLIPKFHPERNGALPDVCPAALVIGLDIVAGDAGPLSRNCLSGLV